MKNNTFFTKTLLFLAITAFFVLPPVFFTGTNPGKIQFPLTNLIYFVFAVFLYFFSKQIFNFQKKEYPSKILRFIKNLGYTTTTFGVIFATGMIFNLIAWYFNIQDSFFVKPDSVSEYCFVFLNFLFAAFYEEVLYRFYIPEQISDFLRLRFNKRTVFFAGEGIALILFALGHQSRGILAVLNAAVSYITLRICLKKSQSILPGSIAHFLHNSFCYLLAIIQAS